MVCGWKPNKTVTGTTREREQRGTRQTQWKVGGDEGRERKRERVKSPKS